MGQTTISTLVWHITSTSLSKLSLDNVEIVVCPTNTRVRKMIPTFMVQDKICVIKKLPPYQNDNISVLLKQAYPNEQPLNTTSKKNGEK